jgi:hypothetical protein
VERIRSEIEEVKVESADDTGTSLPMSGGSVRIVHAIWNAFSFFGAVPSAERFAAVYDSSMNREIFTSAVLRGWEDC